MGDLALPGSPLASWSGTDPCGGAWYGISCSDSGEVVGIKLKGDSLPEALQGAPCAPVPGGSPEMTIPVSGLCPSAVAGRARGIHTCMYVGCIRCTPSEW